MTLAPQQHQVKPHVEHGGSYVFHGADWRFYTQMLRQIGDQRIFLTYDQGRLEMMSPSWEHDWLARAVEYIVRVVSEQLDVPLKSGGSTTFRRQDLERGLEPDCCYYIANERAIRGRKRIVLPKDPPPDLVVEVEVSHRALDRLGIYAALGVPEVWRHDGAHMHFLRLRGGKYRAIRASGWFAGLAAEHIDALLAMNEGIDDTAWGKKVRAWAAKHLAD